MEEKIQQYSDKIADFLFTQGPSVVGGILVLIIGWWIIQWFTRVIKRGLRKSKMDDTLIPFLSSIFNWGLKIMLLISVASMIGIETTSFIAVLGAIGLAVGLALQGTLGNFAGGVILLVFKPYRKGDVVEIQGYTGRVDEVLIFTTKLVTFQNETVILPNGAITNGSIQNFTAREYRRVDVSIGISYTSNIQKARDVLLEVMKDHPKVLKDPSPFVKVTELGDSSVNLAVRSFCKPDDYFEVYWDVIEKGKIALDENKITIPFPQRDVHLFQHS